MKNIFLCVFFITACSLEKDEGSYAGSNQLPTVESINSTNKDQSISTSIGHLHADAPNNLAGEALAHSSIFKQNYSCDDEILLKYNNLSNEALTEICNKLSLVRQHFFELFTGADSPVKDHEQKKLNVHLFSSFNEYQRNIKAESRLQFAEFPNGGFFYEGRLSSDNAHIYLFFTQLTKIVWNLEHEFAHFLVAKYVKAGEVIDTPPYLFWEEGLAEYLAEKLLAAPLFTLNKNSRLYSLNEIKSFSYNNINNTVFYQWSKLAIEYLITEHYNLFYLLYMALRDNKLDYFEKAIADFSASYETEFNLWIKNKINNK